MGAADAFAAALAASGLRQFTRIDHRMATGSTNEDAQQRLGEPGAAGVVIVADEQTAGRGRRGRRWVAPPRSGLLFTAILPQQLAATDAWAVTFWAGLRVAAALGEWSVDASLQWPNDLLVQGRKICGILCVSRIAGDRATVACGIGLNVHRPENRPELDEIVPAPIFLDDVTVAGDNARAELLVTILREFESHLALLHEPQRIVREWEAAAGLPGARYRLGFDDGSTLEGEAQRLSPAGALVLRADGKEHTIELAAEVRALR